MKRTSKVVACCTVLALAGISRADISLDLTTVGSSGFINTAFFQQIDPQSTGTGVIQSFLRIQGNGTEKGYNTDGALEFDTKAGAFTHSLLLSDVPIVNIGGTNYRQFLLDINQTSANALLSLDVLQIYQANSGSLTGFPSGFGSAIYDLDAGQNATIEMNYSLNPGSGAGDMFAYIPDSLFNNKTYVYMYNEFGVPNPTNDGFEEWAVLKGSDTIVPSPSASVLALIGLTIVGARRPFRKST